MVSVNLQNARVFLALLMVNAVSLGLRMVRLDIPSPIIHGDAAWLNCTFDLESDELYAVKWYKNDVEFYRYLPKDNPPGQKYDLPGVYADINRSGRSHVYLKKTDLKSEGLYRCEVSAEAPSFQTAREEKNMTVYVLPDQGPTIYGNLPEYGVGDVVNVTCHSGPSKPVAKLKWFINDKEASPGSEVRYPIVHHPTGLMSTSLGLTFVVDPRHLWHGTLILRCTASIAHAYSMSTEETIMGNRAWLTGTQVDGGRTGPIISGGKTKYHIGDWVDVNCTSTKSKQTPHLQWFIRDMEARPEYLIKYPNIYFDDGHMVSVLGLKFRVEPWHFQNGEMLLKCTATSPKHINRIGDEVLVESRGESSRLHDVRNTPSGKNSSSDQSSNLLLVVLFLILPNIRLTR